MYGKKTKKFVSLLTANIYLVAVFQHVFCHMLQRREKESEIHKRNPGTIQGCNKDFRRRHSYCRSRYTCGEATQEDVGTEENPHE